VWIDRKCVRLGNFILGVDRKFVRLANFILGVDRLGSVVRVIDGTSLIKMEWSFICFVLSTFAVCKLHLKKCITINTATNLSNSYSNDMLMVKVIGISGYALAGSFQVYKEVSCTLLSCIQALFTKRAM